MPKQGRPKKHLPEAVGSIEYALRLARGRQRQHTQQNRDNYQTDDASEASDAMETEISPPESRGESVHDVSVYLCCACVRVCVSACVRVCV